MDRSYVSRLFRQETGISLKEYIWKTKEEEACRLLIDISLPIHVVARSVGFEDPLHFTKTFKKKLDCSPKAFRRQRKNETQTSSSADS
ncbi:helix-turn-helix transcriptional regulator [uncultured Dubosiella sp.]|uniref:helix-turn-helix domain-containing protein n=1 Tax=uncultured Dubosiella sp. TaxID=1937011 RepID=UPI0034282B1C